MPDANAYTLISFPLCPFVQRAVILLRHKQIAFDMEYIDLENKPQWFLDKVPTGKVPALFVGKDVLFESSIINEYLDEVTPLSLFSQEPWTRAQQRAWINYSDQLLSAQYVMMISQNDAEYVEREGAFITAMATLAQQVKGPFFSGPKFSLTDAAIAPLLMRLALTPTTHDKLLQRLPKDSAFQAWMDNLLSMDVVQNSVQADFDAQWHAYFKERGIALTRTA